MPAGSYTTGEGIMASIRTVSSSTTVTRRGLLRLGAGSLAAWTLAAPLHAQPRRDFRCILLNLVGGPSHLDTWDPKPDAPAEYRGPFATIPTKIPGVRVTELFPKLARILDRVALVRSVYHDEAPIHETGLQLVQTGRVVQGSASTAHVARELTRGQQAPLIPGPVQNTGVSISHGQEGLTPAAAGWEHLDTGKEDYGPHRFGQACRAACRLVERGARSVTVNMFDTVYDRLSWDCHHDGGSLNVSLDDYRRQVGPMFDQAYSALILDLEQRGLLQDTLVVAAGEFGRSPRINLRGGRDHWTGAWTVLLAGGGIAGGQVLGRTDALGRTPVDRPVHASALANTILDAAGLPWQARYPHSEPLRELFGQPAAPARVS